MLQTLLLICVVLLLLALERGLTTWAIRKPAAREFIRRHYFLHPNGISLLRFPQGLVAVLLAASQCWAAAILWFSFWMITDLTDGTIARGCDLKTPAGEWLDPLADKFMSFPVLLFLALDTAHTAPPRPSFLWIALYCLIDVVGQCSRFFCQKKAANSFGKVKTALVTILIAVLSFYQFCTLEKQAMFPPLTQLSQEVVDAMTIACVILAFLSLYCKAIPSRYYANSLTLLNFLCGLLATAIAWANPPGKIYVLAFVVIFLGQFFDLFDGKMARKFGSTPRGALYDDIADGTSFGLACGSIIFRILRHSGNPLLSFLAPFIALFYLGCVLYRLRRFLHPTQILPKGIFQGMPSPAGALLAGAAAMLMLLSPSTAAHFLCAALVVLSGALMVSHIPYRHFGRDLWPSIPRGLRISFLIAIIFITCFALVKKGWTHAFLLLIAVLTATYALGAIATPRHLKRRQEEEASGDEGAAPDARTP